MLEKSGFELSSGDLLFFIDSDDYIVNNQVFEKINNIYTKNKFDILFFKYIIHKQGKEKIFSTITRKTKFKEGMHSTKILRKRKLSGALWSKIFVREKMKTEFFSDNDNYEDYHTTYMYLNICNNFYFTNEIFYCTNRDNINSISKKMNKEKVFRTVDLLKETYEKTNYKLAFTEVMYMYYMLIRRISDKNNVLHNDEKEQIKKARELEPYFNFVKLLILRIPFKEYLKYIYYKIKDIKKE